MTEYVENHDQLSLFPEHLTAQPRSRRPAWVDALVPSGSYVAPVRSESGRARAWLALAWDRDRGWTLLSVRRRADRFEINRCVFGRRLDQALATAGRLCRFTGVTR